MICSCRRQTEVIRDHRMMNAISALVGEELEKSDEEWSETVVSITGFIYGIPQSSARQVIKYRIE